MKLSEIKTKNEFMITEVKDGELKRRLLDMGFVPGCKIKVMAQMSGTVLINIRGALVALRNNATDSIFVEAV